MLKSEVYQQITRIGQALASPKRLELMELLCQGEKTVEALARETRLSVANASHHLQVLRAAHLVEARREGRSVVYRVADPRVCDFFVHLRTLAESQLPEIERIVRRFLEDLEGVEPVDRKTLVERVRRGEVVVVDVRPPEEYRAGHIAGAVSIPLKELERRMSELPRDREIVAYCRGPYCVLAVQAVRLLRANGFRAFRLPDSVHDWRLRGLPVVGEERLPA